MFCKNCGCVLDDDAKFCTECGTKVEREINCPECGTKLSASVKFCKNCGCAMTRQPADSEEVSEKKVLAGVLKTLDPVARHLEFYRGELVGAFSKVINNHWIFYLSWSEKYAYMMDESGENKVKFEMGDNQNISLCGMNNKGVWWLVANNSGHTWNRIICFNPETNEKKEITFNSSKARLEEGPYIYEDTAYYIGSTGEGKQKLVKVDAFGAETVLYENRKGEYLCSVCADANRVAFYVAKGAGTGHWCIMDTYGDNVEMIGNECGPKGDGVVFVEIPWVDLKNNIMWTTMTDMEQQRYGTTEKDLVARKLGQPMEFVVLTYTESKKLTVFKNGAGYQKYQNQYFDGKDMYASRIYWELLRIDSDGNETLLQSPGGHGACDRFLVSNSYVYVNYDAEYQVRLPRKFHSTTEPGRNNPEALLIFGEEELRL